MKKTAKTESTVESYVDEYLTSLLKESKNDELSFLKSFVDLSDPGTIVINGDYSSDGNLKAGRVKNIISIDSLNYITGVNDFIAKINAALPKGGLMACKFYPDEARIEAIRRQHNNALSFSLACISDYLKEKIDSHVRNTATKAKSKSKLPFAEALGRVAAGGFDILDYHQFGKCVYFIAKKVSKPAFNESESKGWIFRMKRVGKNGAINVYYKFRTMHLYAEYLQNFVYEKNGMENGDKFIADFRVTKIGSILRKYWLDELPMLVNLLKGDLKLIGVRPLSNHKFSLYNKRLQDYRTKFKPGLIPPFYADMPESFKGLMDSEMRYLKAYEKQPLKTDVKYFFKTLYNIVLKGARSR